MKTLTPTPDRISLLRSSASTLAALALVLLNSTASAQTLKLRLPLNEAYTGASTNTASDTSNGGANVVLTMYDYTGAPADYHGQPSSGPPVGASQAMDFSSGMPAGAGPVAATNTSALAFGTVSSWTVTYWFKQSATSASATPARFFSLGMNATGQTDNGEPNNISMRLGDATDFWCFAGFNKVIVPTTQVAGQWRFCALVCDGAVLKVYLGADTSSAALVSSNSLANTGAVAFSGSPYIFLGNRADRQRSIAGWLADFRFYSGTGTAAFVEGVRQATAPAPAAPADLAATPHDSSISLVWAPQPNAISYNVMRSTSSGAEVTITNVTSTSFTNTGLVNYMTYYYEVTAVGAYGESPVSTQVSTTPAPVPPAPAGLSATAGDKQVSLSWNQVAGAIGYNVKRSTTSGANFVTLPAGANIAGTSLIDLTAYTGVTYYYVVTALNPVESTNSAQASATPHGAPTAPTGLSALPDASQIELTWTPSPGVVTSYNVKRGGSGAEVTITNVTGTAFVDTNVVVGSTYYYTVSALNQYGQGPDSAEVSSAAFGVPPLQLVMPFKEPYTGSNLYTSSDTNLGPVDVTLTCYETYYSFGYVYVPTDLHGRTNSGVGGSSQALDLSAPPGGYSYVAYAAAAPSLALGSLGSWTASIWFKDNGVINKGSLFVIGDGPTSAAGQPNSIGVRLSAANRLSVLVNDTINLPVTQPSAFTTNTWYFVAVTFDGVNLRTYLGTETNSAALAATTNLGPTTVNLGASGSGTLLVGNQILDTTDPFVGWLGGFRFYGGASDAAYVESIRQAGSTGLPFKPAGVAATAGNHQVGLSWMPTVGAASYNVKRSTTSGANYVTLTNLSAANYADLTALNGTPYYYVVSGVNTTGEGANSLQVSATPLAPPAAPATLTATARNSNPMYVKLQWPASSGATSYNLKRSTTSGAEVTFTNVLTISAYYDSTVTNGVNYFYVVTALNSSGEGANSPEASARPLAAPTGVTGTPGNHQIALSWTAVTGATSYNVKAATVSGAEATITNVTTTSFVDLTAANGITNYYVVAASNTGGEGPSSAEVRAAAASGTTPATPRITGCTQSGYTLTILGSGTPSATYALYGASNLTTMSSATVVTTGTFDAMSGTSTNAVTISPSIPKQFFRLKSPYP